MVLASNKSINIEEPMDQRFAELLGIIDRGSVDGFSSKIFEQAPHRWHAANFPVRLTLAEVKTLFYSQPFREADLRLVKGGNETLASDGLFDQRKFIRPQQAWASIEGGATLVLKNFDNRHPATQELCRGLELLFHHAAIANLYVTPAGYQGLPLHQDYHDVIVCQLEGAKRWQVYERQAIPTENWPSFPPNEAAAGPLLFEHTLVPGDIMYLPRGSHHRATAQEQTSVHVTIGLHAKKWGDLLTGLVAQLTESHEVFRRSLPLGFLDPDWNARAHPAWSEMLTLLAAAAPASAQDDLRRRMLKWCSVPPRLAANGLEPVLRSGVALQRIGLAQLDRTADGGGRLHLPGLTLDLSKEDAEFMQGILNCSQLSIENLPGPMSQTQVELLARLVSLRVYTANPVR